MRAASEVNEKWNITRLIKVWRGCCSSEHASDAPADDDRAALLVINSSSLIVSNGM